MEELERNQKRYCTFDLNWQPGPWTFPLLIAKGFPPSSANKKTANFFFRPITRPPYRMQPELSGQPVPYPNVGSADVPQRRRRGKN
jgi:hypothetical protein